MKKVWDFRTIRNTFIDFFRNLDHTFVRSSPVVPFDDPTILFTNAGMNQYKPLFLGQVVPGSYLEGLKRAVNSQACIRAGGKHNDLEDVGKDVYHHTFFEMLGNWSFGDYFKREAIVYSFKLLTEIYELPKSRLYATYFGGDTESGLDPDEEAKNIWLELLPPGHVIPGSKKDNFWEMGEVGPCGPCSEIHYDRIGGRFAAQLVNNDDPNVIEIWNNVFIQYNRELDKSLKLLPAKHVDTGMGFERITSILQNKYSNYDTDIFQPLLRKMEELSTVHPYTGKVNKEDIGGIDMAYRVVVDHIRTVSFAISDGCVPSGSGRGYVIRRIIRRAIRYGQEILKANKGFFVQLLPVLIEQMKDMFPLLEEKQKTIEEILIDEEESFSRTLGKGLKYFKREVDKLKELKQTEVSGELAFYLYGTLGFPLDLTCILASENNLSVNIEQYNHCLSESRELARNNQKDLISGKELHLTVDDIGILNGKNIMPTDDIYKYTPHNKLQSKILSLYLPKPTGFVDFYRYSQDKQLIGIIMDKTSFYATSGGQCCDVGKLTNKEKGVEFEVLQVLVFGSYISHIGYLNKGDIELNLILDNHIDHNNRLLTTINHSSTHMLNYAIRQVMEDLEIDQKGSYVESSKFRFDFNFKRGLTTEEIIKIENLVNKQISSSLPLYTKEISISMAKSISGIRAVFGETYPDPVRVVSIGIPIEDLISDPSNEKWKGYSIELCGGTHVTNTVLIKNFSIIEEGSIAKGIRRITAYTNDESIEANSRGEVFYNNIMTNIPTNMNDREKFIKDMTTELNACNTTLIWKDKVKKFLNKLSDEIKQEKKEQTQKLFQSTLSNLASQIDTKINENIKYIIHKATDNLDNGSVVKVIENLRKQHPTVSIMYINIDNIKNTANIFSYIGNDVQGKTNIEWLRNTLEIIGGKCGGNSEILQGQGRNIDKLDEAVRIATDYIK